LSIHIAHSNSWSSLSNNRSLLADAITPATDSTFLLALFYLTVTQTFQKHFITEFHNKVIYDNEYTVEAEM